MTDENGDRSGGGESTRLARRWRALDRGWQALLLGLGIVAVHLAVQPF